MCTIYKPITYSHHLWSIVLLIIKREKYVFWLNDIKGMVWGAMEYFVKHCYHNFSSLVDCKWSQIDSSLPRREREREQFCNEFVVKLLKFDFSNSRIRSGFMSPIFIFWHYRQKIEFSFQRYQLSALQSVVIWQNYVETSVFRARRRWNIRVWTHLR